MKKETRQPYIFNSIADLNRALGMPAPLHPLVSLVDYKDIRVDVTEMARGMLLNLYKISYNKHYRGKLRYGQHYYDFDAGGLCFVSPNQIIAEAEPAGNYEGFTLLIHPDFLRGYPLGQRIKNYGFFSYSANESLHLSEKERSVIFGVFKSIQDELELPIDPFSQDVVVSQIELLLNYCNRFYNRQFITRKTANHDLLTRLDDLLLAHFDTENALLPGLPTVQDLSEKLQVSPRYLSDMLRSVTGQNTQQHIHARLIEKAKEILGGTRLSVAEVAYRLGFEHPQSFNRIFKQKTNLSPVEFRQSLS